MVNHVVFGDPSFTPLARKLAGYDLRSVLACVGGLLTVPEYHPQTLRLEVLLHLALLHCRGRKRPTLEDLRKWLEVFLGEHPIKRFEDPPEDVFVSNVMGPGGNYRIFAGTWTSSHAYVQDVVDCLGQFPSAPEYEEVRRSVLALLRLSDDLAQRSALVRWTYSSGTETTRFLGRPNLAGLADRVTFSHSDLTRLGIGSRMIEPFLLPEAARSTIAEEYWGRTSLERHPIVPFAEGIVFACPSAASAAIRRYTLEWLESHGMLDQFGGELRFVQRDAALSALEDLVETDIPSRGELLESPPPVVPFPVPVDAAVCAFDVDKLAHVVLVHDRLSAVSLRGLTSDRLLPDQGPEPFHAWLTRATEMLAANGTAGLTILVQAGLGRGLGMKRPTMPRGWHLVQITLPDFVTFASARSATLLRLWKLYEQAARLKEYGVSLKNLSGPLNLLEFWASQGFRLIPDEFPYPRRNVYVGLPTDNVQDFRVRELRLNDVHAAPVDAGMLHTPVRRMVRESFFQDLTMRPVYVAEETGFQRLAGVVEGRQVVIWVRSDRPEVPEEVAAFLYTIWKGLLEWIDRAMADFEASIGSRVPPPVHVHVSLHDITKWAEFSRTAGQGPAEPPAVTLDTSASDIRIEIPYGFTAYLYRPTNDGERLLLELLCEALLGVLAEPGGADDGQARREAARAITAAMIPSQHARSVHLFNAPDPADGIEPDNRTQPRFVQPEDRAASRMGLGWRLVERPGDDSGVTIGGKDEATRALNDMVEIIWQGIRERLAQIDGPSLVRMALGNNEFSIRDRKWWRRTARALTALYEGSDDVTKVAGERENERALAIHAGRILVEMAVPTCPKAEGREASLSDFDALLASVGTIVDLAADSDAIHGGLAEGTLRIHPNGMVAVDRSLIASVANPYAMELHAAGFREAIGSYEHLYAGSPRATRRERQPDYQAADFAAAFLAEYGITPDQFLEAAGELVDLAVERGTIVTITSRRELGDRLCTNRRFTAGDVDALLGFFALVPRKRWDAAPRGFQSRDWLPWKYRRRLSLVARPLVLFGSDTDSPLLYGVNQLAMSTSYLLDGIENASLPNEFFTSAEMQRYRGSVAEKRGHAFEEEVAAELRRMGWQSRTSVQMPSIGAPAELGDVDVVAWHPGDPRLLLIECKRLQTARGLGEIVERLNQFRGDSKDRLGRHLRRHEWIQANLASVVHHLSIRSGIDRTVPVLVVNADVPMQFQQGLPLRPEHILPLHRVAERLVPGED
jgi:Holliday junction resolvase